MINKLTEKSDYMGVMASSFCLLHCIASPLVFAMQSMIFSNKIVSFWWKSLDYVFVLLSFFAVYWSSKNTSKEMVKNALWLNWFVLTIAILNEKIGLFSWSEFTVYIPSITLIFLHLYNKKYCQCNDEKCCIAK